MIFSCFGWWNGGHGQAQNHCKYNGIRAFFMFGGVGSMGGFRIIENTKVLHIFHDLCRGVGSMGGPETLRIQ